MFFGWLALLQEHLIQNLSKKSIEKSTQKLILTAILAFNLTLVHREHLDSTRGDECNEKD